MKRLKKPPVADATDLRRKAYDLCNWSLQVPEPESTLYRDSANLRAEIADDLESQEPAAHQPAGFVKRYTTISQ